MKFSTKDDIEAPIEFVFDELCDFEAFERSAMRRGAEVQRQDKLLAPGVGMIWDTAFLMRGKRREMRVEVVTFERPEEIVLENSSSGMVGQLSIELMSLSRSRTRVNVALEMKPLNLSTRLLVQSLKLAKANLNKKFKTRVSAYARGIEERYCQKTQTGLQFSR